MKKTLLLYLLPALLLAGCKNPLTRHEEVKNFEIDESLRNQINDLNIKAFSCLKLNDYTGISAILSDDIKEHDTRFKDTTMPRIARMLEGRSFTKFDEYYIDDLLAPVDVKIRSGDDINDYNITYHAKTRKSYVSLMLLNGDHDDGLLMIVYGNFLGNWRIVLMELGEYTIYKKYPSDYYNDARQFEQQGALLDALNAAGTAKTLAHPAEGYLTYDIDKKIQTLNDRLIKEGEAKYKFPIPIPGMPNAPKIMGVRYKYLPDGAFPVIYYTSAITVRDTVALRKENMELRKRIPSLFEGLVANNRYVIYEACNKMPEGNEKVDMYRFVQKADVDTSQ